MWFGLKTKGNKRIFGGVDYGNGVFRIFGFGIDYYFCEILWTFSEKVQDAAGCRRDSGRTYYRSLYFKLGAVDGLYQQDC